MQHSLNHSAYLLKGEYKNEAHTVSITFGPAYIPGPWYPRFACLSCYTGTTCLCSEFGLCADYPCLARRGNGRCFRRWCKVVEQFSIRGNYGLRGNTTGSSSRPDCPGGERDWSCRNLTDISGQSRSLLYGSGRWNAGNGLVAAGFCRR